MCENKLGTEENPLPYAQVVAYESDAEDEENLRVEMESKALRRSKATPVELLVQALGEHGSGAEVLVPEQCATVYIGGRELHVTVEEIVPVPPSVCVKLYPLTQAELHAAEENSGYTEHVQWHEISCTDVWVEAGVPYAVYEFWYMGDEGKPEWCKFWLTVRDGKLYGEY